MMDRDLHGNTALHEAVYGRHFDTIKLLLETWKEQSLTFKGTYDYVISIICLVFLFIYSINAYFVKTQYFLFHNKVECMSQMIALI